MRAPVRNLTTLAAAAAALSASLSCGPGNRGAACATSSDCPAPQTCVTGHCVASGFCIGSPSCNDDSMCAAGQHCANGCCQPGAPGTCGKDADCSSHPTTPICDVAPASGICVGCLFPSDCGPGQLCQDKACVALPGCSSNVDCRDSAAPVCDVAQRACVQCLGAADCRDAAKPNCDGTHHCVGSAQCRADADCAKPTPRCQLSSGRCVSCLDGTDCPTGKICDPKQLICISPAATTCSVDADCASNPAAPHCKLGTETAPGTCVACVTDPQCPAGEICQASSNTCVLKQCGVDADCASPTPRCDLTGSPHVCVACTADKDCPNGGTCQPDHTCKAPANFCNADQDCAQNLVGQHCNPATHACVQCVKPADCGAGKTCTAQNTCASSTCTSDQDCAALAGTTHCNPASGACVQCTAAAQCGAGFKCTAAFTCAPVCTAATQKTDCSAPTPVCKESAAGNACVQCVQSSDCATGQVCTTGNVCVAQQTGCASNADCPPTTPVCNLQVTPHACVQCLSSADCKNGMGCDLAAHSCTATGAEGQVCGAGRTCNAGLNCLDEGGPNGPVCRAPCDPYSAACAPGRVCAWLGFSAGGAFGGDCVPPNGHGALGAACDPRVGDSCEWNLLCAPRSSTSGICASICNPAGGSCASGVCNAVVGAVSPSGAAQSFGYCGPASHWGQACTTDTGVRGPDCGDPLSLAGNGGLFCSPSYLPAESPQASVLAVCSYTPAAVTAVGGASASCAAHGDNDCRTGVCLRDGPVSCFAGCTYTSDCTRDGASSTYCFDLGFSSASKTSIVASCEPICRNDSDCAALGTGFGRTCLPLPTHMGSSWHAVCAPVAGKGKAGVACTGGSDCASGTCVTGATLEAIELGLSVANFSATDGFCLGSCSSSSDCGAAGTACSLDAALPLQPRDTGDQGVAGRPGPGVCWPQGCTSNSDCTGFSRDGSTPRVCAPYKRTTSSTTDSARGCTYDTDCASGVCNSTSNNPNPGGVFGASAGVFGPNNKCRAASFALDCAPSLGAARGGPGAACSHSDGCQTGHCVSNGTATFCFGGCASSADCAAGTSCKAGSYLGMSLNFCQP